MERGTVRVKCLAQEHNTVSLARAWTRTARSGEASVRGVGLKYCCGCFKETLEMVSEKGRFQWRRRLVLLSDFAHWGFDSTTRKELSINMLLQYSDNPERELKLRNVQLLRHWTQLFFWELCVNRSDDNRKLCVNRNTQRQKANSNQFCKSVSKSILRF